VSCQERGRAGLGERVHAVEIDLVQDPPSLTSARSAPPLSSRAF
jgi:hypothetical protein